MKNEAAAAGTTTGYPIWTMRYSGEDMDRQTALAYTLTASDRAAGRPAPKFGFSAENYKAARGIVRGAAR